LVRPSEGRVAGVIATMNVLGGGNLEVFLAALQRDNTILHGRNIYGLTPFLEACRRGFAPIVKVSSQKCRR
jgi:hypothetical protein